MENNRNFCEDLKNLVKAVNKITEFLGNEFSEWVKARSENRAFILPDIEFNQDMYLLAQMKIKRLQFQSWVIKNGVLSGHLWDGNFNDGFFISDIGKKVFFTKEEAESALKALKEANNNE